MTNEELHAAIGKAKDEVRRLEDAEELLHKFERGEERLSTAIDWLKTKPETSVAIRINCPGKEPFGVILDSAHAAATIVSLQLMTRDAIAGIRSELSPYAPGEHRPKCGSVADGQHGPGTGIDVRCQLEDGHDGKHFASGSHHAGEWSLTWPEDR